MLTDHSNLIIFFKTLSHKERLQILYILKEKGELCSQEIEEFFYLEQPTTSHHLGLLKKAGLLKSRKEGRHVYYSLNESTISKNINLFKESLKIS